MKPTEFEFFIHKFDYKLPIHSKNKNLVSDERKRVLMCFDQLKIKMSEISIGLDIGTGACVHDFEVTAHLFGYYKNALRILMYREENENRMIDRQEVRRTYTSEEAAKINSRFD